jgi:adenylate cyclase
MTVSNYAVPLADIDDCFQGVYPADICSVSTDGFPNITYLSIVHRIDDERVALSRQFFNKTIKNLMVNPLADVGVTEPQTGRKFHLLVQYEHTETEGPLFEQMRTRLDAIASQTGMKDVFKLAAADVCRVLECSAVPVDHDIPPPERPPLDFKAVDQLLRRMGDTRTIDELMTFTLTELEQRFDYKNSFVMLVDESGNNLYTVASHGYEASGVGSEVRFGDGVLGVSAERREIISISNMQADLAYSRAIKTSYERSQPGEDMSKEIALPGLARVFSQYVVPIESRDRLLGILCCESEQPGRFRFVDGFVINLVAREMGVQLTLQGTSPVSAPSLTAQISPQIEKHEGVVTFRHYASDDSIFIDNTYLIKGVAGRVLWRLLQSYVEERRVDFSNKEIRLDPEIELPDIKDNLEARLALLRRRLAERCDCVRMVHTGRGRIRLEVARELALREMT